MSKETLKIDIYTTGDGDSDNKQGYPKTRYEMSVKSSSDQLERRNLNNFFNLDKVPRNITMIESNQRVSENAHSYGMQQFSTDIFMKDILDPLSDGLSALGTAIEYYAEGIPDLLKSGPLFNNDLLKMGAKLNFGGDLLSFGAAGYEIATSKTEKERGEAFGGVTGGLLTGAVAQSLLANILIGAEIGTAVAPGIGTVAGPILAGLITLAATSVGTMGGEKIGGFLGGSPYADGKGDPFSVPFDHMNVRNNKIAPFKLPLDMQPFEKKLPVMRDVRNNNLVSDIHRLNVEDWVSRKQTAQRPVFVGPGGGMTDVRNGKMLPSKYSQDINDWVLRRQMAQAPIFTGPARGMTDVRNGRMLPNIYNQELNQRYNSEKPGYPGSFPQSPAASEGLANKTKPIQINVQSNPQYTINTAVSADDVITVITQNQKTIGDMLADEIGAALEKIYGNIPAKVPISQI